MNESTKVSSAMSPAWSKTLIDGSIERMASLVCLSVSELISVIAILVQPERVKPLATAAPMPMTVSD